MDHLVEGEMSPDDLDQSLPLRRDADRSRVQANNSQGNDGNEEDEIQSSAPRTFDRMIKGNVPSYSPLTVSR